MKLKRIFTIVLMCVMSAAMAVAQVHVEAKLDSMVILIGQQTRYVVDVTAPKGSKVCSQRLSVHNISLLE